MTVGERILLRRNALGIKQQAVANTLGVADRTIRFWEQGRTSPTAIQLNGLAKALNTTVAYLLGETDNPEPTGVAPAITPLVDASSATVNAPIAAGRDHVTATNTSQTITLDFSSIPQLAVQLKKRGDIGEMKDAIDFLKSSIMVLERAVQEKAPIVAGA